MLALRRMGWLVRGWVWVGGLVLEGVVERVVIGVWSG